MSRESGCVYCDDCHHSLFGTYMVWDDVWEAAGLLRRHQDVCLGCLEARLKRPLTIEDFPLCSVNALAYAALGRLKELTEAEAAMRQRIVTAPRGDRS